MYLENGKIGRDFFQDKKREDIIQSLEGFVVAFEAGTEGKSISGVKRTSLWICLNVLGFAMLKQCNVAKVILCDMLSNSLPCRKNKKVVSFFQGKK